MMPLLTIVGAVLLVCLVIWAAQKLTAAFGVGEPARTVIIVVVVLVAVGWFVVRFLGGALP